MPGPSINFASWLQRLGFKYDEQPDVIRTIQPVAIVADHRRLVSDPLLCSYLIGANEAPTVGQFAAFKVISPVPLAVDLQGFTMGAGGSMTIQIGAGVGPAVASETVLVPQLFQTGGLASQARWTSGEVAAAPSTLLPTYASSTPSSILRLRVPAGGFMLCTQLVVTNAIRWCAQVDELPNEFAQ